jgi:cell division protein FtsQ
VTITDTKPDPSAAGGQGEAAARKRHRWQLPALLAAGAALLMLSPLWAPLLLRNMAFFRVRHVEVVGLRYIQARDILDRLRVDTLASVWDPTGPLEARVRGHPIVRDVVVERKLPGTLVVRLTEHAPIALVATTNGFRVYDERGVALPINPATADFDAPILPVADTGLFRLLGAARSRAPALFNRVSEARREGRDEFLFVWNSTAVRTLSDVTLERLNDLELVEQDLARRHLRATELDLRFRDQVIARLP